MNVQPDPITFAISSPTVTEGKDAYACFTITLSGPSASTNVLSLALSDGSGAGGAAATGGGVDYGKADAALAMEVSFDGVTWAASTSVSIPPNCTTAYVRTAITDDSAVEANESFTLGANLVSGDLANDCAAGTATIIDNDTVSAARLSVSDVTVTEGADRFAVFTVSLDKAVAHGTPVNLALAGDTATGGGVDFGSRVGAWNMQVSVDGGKHWTMGSSTTIPAGSTSVLVRTAIVDDQLVEGTEKFSLKATTSSTETANTEATGTATIIDNDAASLRVSNVVVTEGSDRYAQFTVSLSKVIVNEAVSFDLKLADGTAKGLGIDYGSKSGGEMQISTDGGHSWHQGSSGTIAAGKHSVLVRTAIIDDRLVESNENFSLTATRTAGHTANDSAKGTATIIDNDTPPPRTCDPLVLDLDGNGVQTTSISAGTQFDLNADGSKEQTGWVGKGDGLLALDLNHNGQIDNGRELFGDNTLLASGAKATNGFAALAQYDSNHDGKIDAKDAIYSQLQVWKDANGNGVADAGELSGLAANKVASIDLGYTASDLVVNGNAYAQVGSYTDAAGAKHATTDVWFQTNANAPALDMRDVVGVDQGIALPGATPSAATLAAIAATGPSPAPLDLHGLMPQQSLAHDLFAKEHVPM